MGSSSLLRLSLLWLFLGSRDVHMALLAMPSHCVPAASAAHEQAISGWVLLPLVGATVLLVAQKYPYIGSFPGIWISCQWHVLRQGLYREQGGMSRSLHEVQEPLATEVRPYRKPWVLQKSKTTGQLFLPDPFFQRLSRRLLLSLSAFLHCNVICKHCRQAVYSLEGWCLLPVTVLLLGYGKRAFSWECCGAIVNAEVVLAVSGNTCANCTSMVPEFRGAGFGDQPGTSRAGSCKSSPASSFHDYDHMEWEYLRPLYAPFKVDSIQGLLCLLS